MPRIWFVGAARVGPPPAAAGDRLVPLSVTAMASIEDGFEAFADLESLEREAITRVFADLSVLVDGVRRVAGERWLTYRGCDLSPALRRPDEAVTGFTNQALAFQIASRFANSGPFAAWGVDAYQLAGLRAAVGALTDGSPALGAALGPPGRRGLPGRLRPRKPKDCDILHLSLEPHVALQQDRVLRLLAGEYRIEVVALGRTSWPWPEPAGFQPSTHLPLISYLTAVDLAREAWSWATRPTPRVTGLPWMLPGERARWLSRTWLRAAGVVDALTRAIEAHHPRLLLGTSMASGVGTVISSVAARHKVAVLSLPTGADYLLPPLFDPADVGQTIFAVPGERLAEKLRGAGVPSHQLVASGWPEMDSLSGVESSELAALREALGFVAERPLVVFFSSPSSAADELVVPAEAKRRGFERLAEACRQAGCQLAVKLHPREIDGQIEGIAARLDPPVPVLRDRLALLLHAADVVASVGSAVSFAGEALGKTTLILEAGSIGRTAAVFASLGIGHQPRSLPEISSLLDGASLHRNPRAVGSSGADGRVAERIRAAVDGLLQ